MFKNKQEKKHCFFFFFKKKIGFNIYFKLKKKKRKNKTKIDDVLLERKENVCFLIIFVCFNVNEILLDIYIYIYYFVYDSISVDSIA